MDDVPPQSRRRCPRLRLFHRGDGHFSSTLWCRPPRRRHAPDRALEFHQPPDVRMDDPAVSEQFPLEGTYRFVIHDRDGIFAPAVDEALRSMSLQVLKTPVHAPQANAHCERFIGTARRECLDWMIPLNERHLRSVLAEWISHYNGERPHSALGPGLPDDPTRQTTLTGHRLPAAHRVVAARVSAACILTTSWNLSRHRFLRIQRRNCTSRDVDRLNATRASLLPD